MQLRSHAKSLIKIFFVSLFFIDFFAGCSKENYKTNLPPSLQKLTEQTECTCNPFINQCTLNGNIIYVYSCGGPACDCAAIYYDAQGEEFYLKNGDHIDFVKQVWSCKE